MTSVSYAYKTNRSFESRLAESRKIRDNFPGRIPVIIEKAARSGEIPTVDKNKFLVPGDLTLGQFIYVVRKRLAMPPEKALFLFVNNNLPTTGALMRELYAQYADEDGFLYSTYGGENTFGTYCRKCTSKIRPYSVLASLNPYSVIASL